MSRAIVAAPSAIDAALRPRNPSGRAASRVCGAGSTAALVLALYINSPDVYRNYFHSWMIWPLAPIILYIILRIWVLAGRGELHDDPVVFIISDWRSQLMIAVASALLLAAAVPW